MEIDRFEMAVTVCDDPACPWAGRPEAAHFDLHNRRCGQLFIGHDGTEVLCELLDGHDGPHRGTTRRGGSLRS